MLDWTRVLDAPLCLVLLSFIHASVTITSAMTTMTAMATVPAVTEEVHRDKDDEDQQPEPVGRKPFHGSSPSGV
jgi:hypothetical protein